MATKKTIRPCDCKDLSDRMMLPVAGSAINDNSVELYPNFVLLTIGPASIKIPMKHFKIFAEWYLEEQEIDKPANDEFHTTTN